MDRAWVMMAGLLGIAGAGGAGPAAAAPAGWQAPAGSIQMPLWPGAVPDGLVAHAPETVEIDPKSVAGLPATMVHDVAVPTLTLFPPKGRNTGAAMMVFPGGGFQLLAIDLEGTEICDWITARGMTCAVLKYRVPNTDTHGDPATGKQVAPKILRALQDAQRAIRLVRARAAGLGVDPHRIGVIGFSAGGYLVAQTSTNPSPAYRPVDAVDRISSRPDFAIAAYPGHLCRDGNGFDPTIHVTKDTPPTFIVQNYDDRTDDICNSTLYAHRLALAGVPAEVHLFAKGGHAFALRPVGHPVEIWPTLAEKWLKEMGIL